MTGAEGEGSSHSDGPRRAAPSRSSDGLAPVPEEGNARSADIATLAGVASSQPLGQSLRALAAAHGLPPRWVLNYQRTLGNQVTQRLLGERVPPTSGQDGSLAPAAAGVQRKYLVPPYVEPSIDFNGLTYADLRAQIETYKSAPGARVNIKQQRLNKLIEVVNGFLSGRLSAPAVRNFEALQQEILAEQALINNAGQSQPQQPTPTPTPIPTPIPTPTPRGPTSTVTTPTPIPTLTPTPQSGTPQVAQARAQSRPPTPVQADPRLLAAEQAQAGVEQLIIAPRVSWTEVATGASYSSASARAGRRVRTQIITSYHLAAGAGIKPLPLQYRLPGGAEIVNITAGTNHTVPSGGWTLNRADVRTGGQPEVRASNVWYWVKVPAHLSEVSQTTVGVWDLAHDDVRASGREVRSNGTWYQLVTGSELTSEDITYDVINLDGTDVRVVSKPENVSVGSVGFKQLPNEQALFPSAPSGADIKQLGLGDCYLQALLINIAEQNPGHLTNMLRDNGNGTVTVRFYTVDETTPTAPAYAPEDIRINKSLPQTATGQALYQSGAPWARIMQKAFAAFAQLHGQYGGAYDPVKGRGVCPNRVRDDLQALRRVLRPGPRRRRVRTHQL
jgi:hypothetical protein